MNFKAKTVIFAAGKSAIKTIFPEDTKLFKDHHYSSWATVTLALRELPERQLLGWRNAVQRPGQSFVDFTWINHANPDEPPVLTHHILFGTGARARAELRATTPQQLIKASIHYLGLFVGRNVTPNIEHAQVHKIDRALIVPAPTHRIGDLNSERSHKRVIYAGADVRSLPTLEAALLSGLKAAELSREITG